MVRWIEKLIDMSARGIMSRQRCRSRRMLQGAAEREASVSELQGFVWIRSKNNDGNREVH